MPTTAPSSHLLPLTNNVTHLIKQQQRKSVSVSADLPWVTEYRYQYTHNVPSSTTLAFQKPLIPSSTTAKVSFQTDQAVYLADEGTQTGYDEVVTQENGVQTIDSYLARDAMIDQQVQVAPERVDDFVWMPVQETVNPIVDTARNQQRLATLANYERQRDETRQKLKAVRRLKDPLMKHVDQVHAMGRDLNIVRLPDADYRSRYIQRSPTRFRPHIAAPGVPHIYSREARGIHWREERPAQQAIMLNQNRKLDRYHDNAMDRDYQAAVESAQKYAWIDRLYGNYRTY